MHEVALAQGLVELVVNAVQKDGARRARTVFLDVGTLSHVMPEALEFGFEVAARGTVAEGARLEFRRPKGRGACTDCGKTSEIDARPALCPACGSARVLIEGGDELRVTELEVD